ncbi:MAG: hypothetical protein EP344_05970 [Bacteroidetes bacterium]|nr:MAG: hypothetical protein EP344_05970 [Bacteroidota bacterium]
MKTYKIVHMALTLLSVFLFGIRSTALQAQTPAFQGASSFSTADATADAGVFDAISSLYVGAGGIWLIVLIAIYYMVKQEQRQAATA